jgi:hypothetical protein
MKTFKFNCDVWVHADSKEDALSHLHAECKWFFGLDNSLLAIQSNECKHVTDYYDEPEEEDYDE